MPSTRDIDIFKQYLFKKLLVYCNCLERKGFDFTTWISLLEVIMIKTQNFNRCPPGETDRTTVADFKNRIKCTEKDEFYEALSGSDKHQLKKYDKMETKGKKVDGIDGTVYLTSEDIKA